MINIPANKGTFTGKNVSDMQWGGYVVCVNEWNPSPK